MNFTNCSKISIILQVLFFGLCTWIISWWPIYGLIWLIAGWKYVVLLIKVKLAIIILLVSGMLLFEIVKELFSHRRRRHKLTKTICYYLVLPNDSKLN